MKVIDSACNTINKSLFVVDNLVDSVSLGTCIIKTGMEDAYIEQRGASLNARKGMLKGLEHLTDEEKASILVLPV